MQRHDLLYYSHSKPEISDYEYDMLLKKLEEIEAIHPDWILPHSPSQRVGEMMTASFKESTHAVPMLSLANTYSREEVEEFIKRVQKGLDGQSPHFCSELKMDGLAISAVFEKGRFVRGVTRGDGKKGDDITLNMKAIRALPMKLASLDPPDLLEVRGEVFMHKPVFLELNKEKEEAGEEPWANPRNAAAGSLKLLNPKEVARRRLSVVFYGIAQDSSNSCKTQSESHLFLEKLGLPVFNSIFRRECLSVDEVLAFGEMVEKKRPSLPFDIDGIVVKVNELKWQQALGATAKHQKWAVAYKFSPEQALTKVLDVTVQVGRTGVLTPVAELDPVFLAGSTIARATLHNQEEITRKDIRINDFVWIEKGGDVIPKVVRVELDKRHKEASEWHMPRQCPCCATLAVHVDGEVAVRCPNKECPEQKLGRIIFFASKDAMDIGHLGGKALQHLFYKGFISRSSDIYKLTENELSQIEGFKEKSIRNILESIEKSKSCTLARFILALGIKYVGEGTAEALAKATLDINILSKMSLEELTQIEGVGDKVAQAIHEFFLSKENQEEVERLLECGVVPAPLQASFDPAHPFYEKTFVLTGSLQDLTRSQAANFIKERGGKVSSSVGSKVDYVLVGEDAGSKLEKAVKLGVPLLTEEEFKSML